MIDSATHQQIGRLFECRDLGALALKGLPDAVQIGSCRAKVPWQAGSKPCVRAS